MAQIFHPTARILTLLELMQAHGQLSGAELALRLGVDRRSLRRYIATLEEMGIPVMTERGRYGGYSLVPGYKMPPMMFSADEAFALTTGLLAVRKMNLVEVAQAIESAAAKLQRLLPEKLRDRLMAVDAAIQFDMKQAVIPANKDILAMLSSANAQRQRVHLVYKTSENVQTERAVDVYGVAFHANCWYVAGMCHLRKDIRSFRLDRIVSAQVLSQSFDLPSDFDVLHYLRKSVAIIPRAHSVEVILKTDISTAQAYIPDALAVLEQTEGGVMLYNQSDDLSWFARQLAAMPFAFEVRKPEALRLEITAIAKLLIKIGTIV